MNLLRLFVISAALATVPLCGVLLFDATTVLANSGRHTKPTLRLMSKLDNAKENHLAGARPDFEGYRRAVKALDASRLPPDVRRAWTNYVAALESHFATQANFTVEQLRWPEVEKAEAELRRNAKRRLP